MDSERPPSAKQDLSPTPGEGEPLASPSGPEVSEGPRVHPDSAMVPRFNLFFRVFARRFFGHFDLGQEEAARLRTLEAQGAVVYVMRYSSRLD